MSFICLSLASVRLFYSQRLGKYREPDPPVLSKQIFIAIPICIQNAIYLSAWIFLTAYIKAHVFWCICIVIFMNFVTIQTFVFRLNSSEKYFDAMLNGVQEGQRESEPRKIFYTAILTSWISPNTVWANNKPIEIMKKRLGKSNKSKYFLLISNVITSITVALILSIYCYGVLSLDGFGIANNPPLAHCFKNKPLHNCSGFLSCFSVCNSDDCPSKIRFCDKIEKSTDLMTNIVIPVLIGLLIINTLFSCFLQYLGSYENMYKFTSNFKFTFIHPTLIIDCAKEDFYSDIQKAVTRVKEAQIQDRCRSKGQKDTKTVNYYKNAVITVEPATFQDSLLKDSTKDILNQQNPITGNTCLLEAYTSGSYELVEKMREKGADPKIKNKVGKNVESCEKRNKIKEFTEKKQTWKNEIFYYEVLTDQDKCKIILRDEDKVNGNIYWSLEIKDTTDPLKINTFFAFGNEACKFLECSEELGKDKTVSGLLSDLSTFERNTQKPCLESSSQKSIKNTNQNEGQIGLLESIKNIFERMFWPIFSILKVIFRPIFSILKVIFRPIFSILKEIFRPIFSILKDIFWKICSFIVYLLQCILCKLGCDSLHTCVASHKMWNFWISHFIFGASLEAKNSDGLVPLQIAIQNLSEFANDTKFARYLLYLGAANYPKTEKEKDQVLKTVDLIRQSQRSTCIWCLLCHNRLPVESLTHIFVHAVQKLCKPKNKNLEAVPESELKNAKENTAQANIKTMSSSNTEQKEKVEEPIQISELIKYLIKLGCNFGAVNEKGETVFHQIAGYSLSKDLEILLENHDLTKAINQPNLQLQTPLHLAVQNGNSDYVRFLIDHGADLNAQDLNLRTPLHYAVVLEKDDCFDLLLENEKAFVDAQDCGMKSPLHIAVIEGKPQFAKELFLHHANANLFDKKLNSPVDYATANGNHEIVNILMRRKENITLSLQSPNEQNQTLPNFPLSLEPTSYNRQMSETNDIVEVNLIEDSEVKTSLKTVIDFYTPLRRHILAKKLIFLMFFVVLFFDTMSDIWTAKSYFELGHWKWALSFFLPIFSPFLVNLFFWLVKIAKNKISKSSAQQSGSFSSVLGHLPLYQHFR
jgi:ankyrin repeat protein